MIKRLEEKARKLRCLVLRMINAAGSGHPGGSLSAAEILSVLYFYWMRVNQETPKWPERDRFILSKGHSCPVLYAALAERGYFPVEALWTLRRIDSFLQGHPDMRKTPGVDSTSGSLGHGLSIGVGMALGGKLDDQDYRVYVLLGDGELQEGQVWEAAMSAAHYKLANLTAIVDYNHLQVDGCVEEIMEVAPLVEKWRAFRWNVVEVDGHNIKEITGALENAEATMGQPTCIIAHTIKGKGVSFMENEVGWHGKWVNDQQLKQALSELGCDAT